MKLAMAAAALTVIGAASLFTSPGALAQDVPPSVHVPPQTSQPPSNIGTTSTRTVSSGFTSQHGVGSAIGDASNVPVAQRFAPTAKQTTSTGTANGR